MTRQRIFISVWCTSRLNVYYHDNIAMLLLESKRWFVLLSPLPLHVSALDYFFYTYNCIILSIPSHICFNGSEFTTISWQNKLLHMFIDLYLVDEKYQVCNGKYPTIWGGGLMERQNTESVVCSIHSIHKNISSFYSNVPRFGDKLFFFHE